MHAFDADSGSAASAAPSAETLLAGVAVRPFAQSAVRAGADAVSVDFFGDRDHRRDLPVLSLRRDTPVGGYSAADLVELAQRVRAARAAYGADLENHPEEVGRLGGGRELLGNPPEALREARDPFRVASVLRDAGVPVPEVKRAGDPPTADREGASWLLKPRRGGGGRGVRPWRRGEAIGDEEYLQERIRGTPVAVLFVADGRRARILAVTEMLVGREAFGAHGFLFCGSLLRLGPEGRPLPPDGGFGPGVAAARRMVRPLVRELGLVGLNGADAVLRDRELWPLEVNPRWTSSMELLEVGRTPGTPRLPRALFALHRQACRGDLPPRGALPGGGRVTGAESPRREPVPERVVGKAVVRARRDALAPDLLELEGLTAAPAGRPASRMRGIPVADVPEPGDPLEEGGPVCTLLASAPGRQACLARLEAGADRVHRALEGEGAPGPTPPRPR